MSSYTAVNKTCQSCNNNFTIYPEDFEFYEKMQVPPPDQCPDCRSQSRTCFRNESTLYVRECDFSKKKIISIYSQDKDLTVYDQKVWWSDDWDPMEYGMEYDFSKSFFEQYAELMKRVPRLSIINKQSVNSDYCNYSNSNKDCYLCFASHFNEACMFNWYAWKNMDCVDCRSVIKSELAYQCNFCNNVYGSAFLEYSFDCSECFFGYNLVGCQNCFLSSNLKHKQYYFMNKQLSKEEYYQKVNSLFNGSYSNLLKILDIFQQIKKETIRIPVYQKSCVDCKGADLMYCKGLFDVFDAAYCEDCRYLYPKSTNVYNSMDTNKMGYNRSEWCYMTIGCGGLSNSRFCDSCWDNNDLTYCNLCFSSSNLFGCIGLKSKEYCILNKQYTKEEYLDMTARIIKQMKENNEWGKFFPKYISNFAYNETTAQEYFPLNKEQAQEQGFKWKDPEQRKYPIDIPTDKIPDNIKDTDSSIVGKIIECAHNNKNCNEQCTTAFKIIPKEYEFYKKMNLPIPRLCPNCRHYQRIKQRNPLKLWKRRCMCNGKTSINNVYTNTVEHSHGSDPCPNEFYTSYSPDRPEIVYCEKCYQSEVV